MGLYLNTQTLLPFVKYMYLSQKAYESLPCLQRNSKRFVPKSVHFPAEAEQQDHFHCPMRKTKIKSMM